MRAIIDLETGGFNAKTNGIVEIALIVINSKYEVVHEFNEIVYPYFQEFKEDLMIYTPEAEAIHGISYKQQISEGVNPRDICGQLDFIIEQFKINTLIGHNAIKFDIPRFTDFLNRFTRAHIGYGFIGVDTMVKAKNQISNVESYSLPNLCKALNIENKAEHRAIGDAYATLELIKILEA